LAKLEKFESSISQYGSAMGDSHRSLISSRSRPSL
jgi:hypothetical protein